MNQLNSVNKKPNVIAVDIGYGNTKVVWSRFNNKLGKECWGEKSFLSIAPRVVVDQHATGLSTNPDKILIELNGSRYHAGPAASKGIESRMIEANYIESDLHEVLLRASIHIAMREMGEIFDEIDVLVLGLPVSGLIGRRDRLREIGMTPREIPVPENLWKEGAPKTVIVTTKQVIVSPQPFGGLRYAAQNLPESDPLFNEGALSMVIDPGYRTFDWFVANCFQPEMKLSGSFDGGAVSILRQISQQIGYDHDTGSLEFDLVEQGLQTGEINLGYKVIDTKKYQKNVVEAARSEVMAFLSRNDANKSRLSKIFLAGGAAGYYEKALVELMPGHQINRIDNPLMANARGYWLTGCDTLND